MSTTRLMILGLVCWLEPVHGYQVRRELLSWNVEDWANIAPGSIYHALRKLTEDGMLQEVATEQVGGRPARTTYRSTSAGREEFSRLLRKYWWEYRQPADPFLAAFSYLPALPRREAVAALRNRANVLRGMVSMGRGALESLAATPDKPVHVQWQLELCAIRQEAEISWLERTAERIAAGEGAHLGDPEEPLEMPFQRWREQLFEGHVEPTQNKQS